MQVEKGIENFNSMTVSLEGSNLIEASAGTGKTYSIAILVLRMILEKKFSVKEILMVTFTKAAVAELEERVRLFIRLAYKSSQGEAIKDSIIAELVDRGIAENGSEYIQSLLREAVLFLDETSVLTIHSFCQLTLTEFAFETQQLFGAETLQDGNAVLGEEVNKFWRKEITTLPAELLQALMEHGLSREGISNVVKEHLDGKRFFDFRESEDYSMCDEDHQSFIKDIRALKVKEDQLKKDLLIYLKDNQEKLRAATEGSGHAKKAFLNLLDDPEAFLDALLKKRDSAYVIKLYQDILDQCDVCAGVTEELVHLVKRIISRVYCHAISKVSRGVAEHKRRNNQMSFDDMIVNLHDALVKRESSRLIEKLRDKYKAVFVDEFQDTDRLQYEIFQKAFGEDVILFYIGDPKQSIYAWRKADIFTYFKACDAVTHRYGMNQNYRSSADFIDAMNVFFKPAEDFDTFYFQDAEHAIEYIDVESPASGSKGALHREKEAQAAITVFEIPNKDAVYEAVAAQVIELLNDPSWRIVKKPEEERTIGPADIGILVRTNTEGRKIKAALAKYRIPSVTIGDDKVLQSEEAVSLLYVLIAISDISLQNINRALLSEFTGFSTQDILFMDDEKALSRFTGYKTAWDESGVFAALMAFVKDYSVKTVLLERGTENGERIITNLFQLIELLHKVQMRKNLSPLELISWLKRAIEGMETEGDEYEQRVESDEESIKIVTIHKSKGLEYKIVLAPFLDFVINNNSPFCSFRDAETGEYVSAARESLTEEQIDLLNRQLEQENRRLLYVAVTRAVYTCYLYKITGSYYRNSTLSVFTGTLKGLPGSPIVFRESPAVPAGYLWQTFSNSRKDESFLPVEFSLADKFWRKMSYSMLSAGHSPALLARAGAQADAYDHFIFTELTRGAKSGNLLHFIFENVQFANPDNWPFAIEEAIKRFAPAQMESYPALLSALLDHVLKAELRWGNESFRLTDISARKQLHELEFDFQVPLFRASLLESLAGPGEEIHVGNYHKLEGLMNGKIDLFFEWNGKYFILDWKSNYLGDTLDYYMPGNLLRAMNDNNYHLQYLIYTVAAKKFLESRLPHFDYQTQFGGVIYLFVRGIRKGGAAGIFMKRPDQEQIERLERILGGEMDV